MGSAMKAVDMGKSMEGTVEPFHESVPILQPNAFDRKRIESALSRRKRYRYVDPAVLPIEQGYLVRSPCCSRNIDAEGGVIDIAMLLYLARRKLWGLYRRNHRDGRWELYRRNADLPELVEILNRDSERLFWQ